MNYDNAKQRVKELQSFYKNFIWFIIISVTILFRNYDQYEQTNYIYPGSIIFMIWGIILTVKAVKLFILNAEWENKIIEEEIRKVK